MRLEGGGLLTGRAGLGLGVMDSYLYHDRGIWCDFPGRHGTWSKLLPFFGIMVGF